MVKSITDYTILNNGIKMPWLGYGVFQIDDGPEIKKAINKALEVGYRNITRRILENAQLFDFAHSPSDMTLLDSLDEEKRMGANTDDFDF
jgi:diketogulonate reductase-like aldo/keto reductase